MFYTIVLSVTISCQWEDKANRRTLSVSYEGIKREIIIGEKKKNVIVVSG
jgi:hypothetical protein